ncbi:MAG TPA: hypothetical protein VF462_05145 [Micromonosporaceae bacterium]
MRVTTRRGFAVLLAGGPATVAAMLALAGPAAAQSAPPPVSVMIETAGTTAPAYRIAVRNDTDRPVTTTVRQQLPRGAPPTAVSDGGEVRPAVAGDRSAPAEVTWQVSLPARGMTMLSTTLAARPPGSTVTAPTCAFDDAGSQAYDCTAATWVAPRAPVRPGQPLWRQELVLVPSAAMLLVGVAVGLVVRRGRRRYAQVRRSPGTAGNGAVPGSGASGPPRSAPPRSAPPSAGPSRPARSSPPQWGVRPTKPATALVVGLAAAGLAVTLALTGWTGTEQVAGMNPNTRPTNGAWIGRTATGALGASLQEAAFDMTVYRLVCDPSDGATRTCLATVYLHNRGGTEQRWHAGMQRIYLPSGNWVSADDSATRAANRGQDPFADPVPPGDSRLVALAFSVPAREQPVRIELRSGAFSAGVSVAL